MTDPYEEAIREWVARKLQRRGHQFTRDQIRNLSYSVDEGFPGTDVTPGDDPAPAIKCELLVRDKWQEHEESIEFITPSALVQECLAIYHELNDPPAPEGTPT